MNTAFKTLTFACLALVGAAAGAAEADRDYPWGQRGYVEPGTPLARAGVVADRNGALAADLVFDGETGLPWSFPASIKPRVQVVAEAAEARRLMLVDRGELNLPSFDTEQQRLIAEAGLRALGNTVAQGR